MSAIFFDPELERQFRKFGYVVVPLLDAARVDRLFDFFHETQTPNIGGFHGTMYHNDRDYRIRVDEVMRPTLDEAIAPILVDYRTCMCNYMIKEPGEDASEMPLHQDWSFVHEPREVAAHIWCPLVDVDHQNGCLAVVPGSHHFSDPVRAFADDIPFREQLPTIREKFVLEIPMKRGWAVLFDGRLVHSSPANRSPNRRVTAQAIGVPRSATLYHSWRISPTQVETYEITDEFFFDYVLHQPPKNVKSHAVLDYVPKQLTADEVAKLEEYLADAPMAEASCS